MGKVDVYMQELRGLNADDWDDFLLTRSGLPGRHANIELARAVAAEGDAGLFDRYLERDPTFAPVNTPEEFLAFCGILGLGRLAAEGNDASVARLRHFASDPRWRCREAVAMALQTLGRADFDRLDRVASSWADGNSYEQRAAVAGLCEPDLLDKADHADIALAVLDGVMESLRNRGDRTGDDFRVLRQALGYCWSVAIVAAPNPGRLLLEKWAGVDDPDVAWVVRQNLTKKRLQRLDGGWVDQMRSRTRR